MAVGVKPGAIIGKGGNKLILLQVDNVTYAAATPTAGTYLYDMGSLVSSESRQETTSVENEAGTEEAFSYTHKTTGVLMQSDKDIIDLIADGVKGKTHLEVKYWGYVNALHQWEFKVVKVRPQKTIKRPGGESATPYDSSNVNHNSAITVSAALLASIAANLSVSNFPTTTVTISVSKQYELVEI